MAIKSVFRGGADGDALYGSPSAENVAATQQWLNKGSAVPSWHRLSNSGGCSCGQPNCGCK